MTFPLQVLAIGAVVAGLVGIPLALGGGNSIEKFLEPSFTAERVEARGSTGSPRAGVARPEPVEGRAGGEVRPNDVVAGAQLERGRQTGEVNALEHGGGAAEDSGEHVSRGFEIGLMAFSVLIAVGGIVLAIARLKPERLVPKRDAAPEEGFEKVLVNKYYVDEIYDKAIVRPVVGTSRGLLWRGIDVGLIDGVGVNGTGYLARFVGWIGSQVQSGQLGTYAWVLALGVLVVLGAVTVR
jgi:NADH-quinone oxidoreductase subunit L